MDDAAGQSLAARLVPARTLRVPAHVSPQLQKSMSALAASPVVAPEPPSTYAEWKAFVTAIDAQRPDQSAILQSLFPHSLKLSEVAGVTVREITPASLDAAKAGKVLIHVHGGGFTNGGGDASIHEAVLGAHYSGMRVVCVDYRLLPDHPFPAGVNDAVAVYQAVIADRAPTSVGVFGTSAGGNLVLSVALKLKSLGAPLPGALSPGTPVADFTGSSDSYAANAGVDGVLAPFARIRNAALLLYANGEDLTDPLISPVYGDFADFPPTILTTGTRDELLSDTVRVYRAMRAKGVRARLEVYEAMSHAEYLSAYESPESASVFNDIAGFFDEHLRG